MKKNKQSKIKKLKKKLKDHTENDFKKSSTIIAKIGGRRVVLDRKKQRELLGFLYAIGSR